MNVFISWSGSTSHKVATAFREWLPSVIQAIEPYVSSEDIDKGARWNTDISKELEGSSFGLLCITPGNKDAAWLNFEAGALSKSLDRARVAPFLFNVQRTDITGPLLQFQSTLFEKEDVRKLVKSMNLALEEEALDEGRLDEIFSVWWPQLESAIGDIPVEGDEKPETRTESDLLSEILELVRGQQQQLASPELFLPPDYIASAVKRGGRKPDFSPAAVRDLDQRWQAVSDLLDDADLPDLNPKLRAALGDLRFPIEYLIPRLDRYHSNPKGEG